MHFILLFQVLWFAPSLPMEEHNFYGNVSFVVDWITLLKEMGQHLYLIDQAIYNTRSYTRILLTNRRFHDLEPLDLRYGSVIFFDSEEYCHIAKAMCLVKSGPHEVQVAIECDNQRAKRMFELCSVQPNNHSQANILIRNPRIQMNGTVNIFEKFKCFKYNTSMNEYCPDNHSVDITEGKIFSLTENVNLIDGRNSYPLTEFMTPKAAARLNQIVNANKNEWEKSNSATSFVTPKFSCKLDHSEKTQSILEQTTKVILNDPWLLNSSTAILTRKPATKLNQITNATFIDQEKSNSASEFVTSKPSKKLDQSKKTLSIVNQRTETNLNEPLLSNTTAAFIKIKRATVKSNYKFIFKQ